jgi:hypothetical protein
MRKLRAILFKVLFAVDATEASIVATSSLKHTSTKNIFKEKELRFNKY